MISVDKKIGDVKATINKLKDAVDRGEISEVFVIAFDAQGSASTYYSGNWQNLGIASALLTAEFIDHANDYGDR